MKFAPLLILVAALAGCGEPGDRLTNEDALVEQGPPEANQLPDELNTETANAARPEAPAMGANQYRAVGNEPGWSLIIRADRMEYLGDYGEVRISEPTPAPFRPVPGTYSSGRLRFSIAPGPCSDGMSDLTYRHKVVVRADGRTVNGCGGGTIAPATLAGTSWSVIAINRRAVPRGADYHVNFSDDRIAAKFGCNSMGGPYSLNGDHLSAGPLEQTLIGCPEPAATFEQQGSQVLSSNMRIERSGGTRMRLVSEAGQIDLRRAI